MSTQPMTTSEKVKQLLEAGCWVRMEYREDFFAFIEYSEKIRFPFRELYGGGYGRLEIDDMKILEIIPRKPKMYPVGTKVRWDGLDWIIKYVHEDNYTYKLADQHVVSHFDVIPVWDEEYFDGIEVSSDAGVPPKKGYPVTINLNQVEEIEELDYRDFIPEINDNLEGSLAKYIKRLVDKSNEQTRAYNTLIKQNHD